MIENKAVTAALWTLLLLLALSWSATRAEPPDPGLHIDTDDKVYHSGKAIGIRYNGWVKQVEKSYPKLGDQGMVSISPDKTRAQMIRTPKGGGITVLCSQRTASSGHCLLLQSSKSALLLVKNLASEVANNSGWLDACTFPPDPAWSYAGQTFKDSYKTQSLRSCSCQEREDVYPCQVDDPQDCPEDAWVYQSYDPPKYSTGSATLHWLNTVCGDTKTTSFLCTSQTIGSYGCKAKDR